MRKEIIKKLVGWYKNNRESPDTVQIYPTNFCNLKCIFCAQRTGIYENEKEVSMERWFEVTKEICEMGVREILISGGGEPLCKPDTTIGIMKIARDYDVEGRLITNGMLWTRELIDETIEMNWKHVIFSIDGPDAQTHDYLRGAKGAFEKTIKNIKLFKKLKGMGGRSVYEIPLLELTTVLNTHNFTKILGLIKLAHKMGMKHVNIEALCVNTPIAERIKLDDVKRKKFFKTMIPKAKHLANSFGITTNFPKLVEAKFIEKASNLKDVITKSSGNTFVDSPCYEPWLWPKIEANGDVWPCSTIQMRTNINKRSFKDIWYGKEFKTFRNRILNGDLPEDCKNCVLTHIPCNRVIGRKLKFVSTKSDIIGH